jgi:hypothetical protein
MWRFAAILILALLMVGHVGAQNEPVPSYATPFDLEQTAGNLTVRVLWASADDHGLEVAWTATQDTSHSSRDWRVELLHDGIKLQPLLVDLSPHPDVTTPSDRLVLAVLRPSGLSGRKTITIELRFTNMRAGGNSEPEVLRFLLDVPFHEMRRWQGEQVSTADGISMMLKAVEYAPSGTYLTLCLPRIVSDGPVAVEFEPYIDDPRLWTEVLPAGIRSPIRAPDIPVIPDNRATPAPVMLPEATVEAVFPSDPTLDKCVDFKVPGLAADADGILNIAIDELRTPPIPSTAAVPAINAALEDSGLPWRARIVQNSLGLDTVIAASDAPLPQNFLSYRWRVYHSVLSDITSERLPGPWTFEVQLD